MSKRIDELEFEVPPGRVAEACRTALAELGWSAKATGEERLEGREGTDRLCCHQSPATVEIELRANGNEGTAIRMSGSVPGFGPVSSEHLSSRMEALWRHLLAAAR